MVRTGMGADVLVSQWWRNQDYHYCLLFHPSTPWGPVFPVSTSHALRRKPCPQGWGQSGGHPKAYMLHRILA